MNEADFILTFVVTFCALLLLAYFSGRLLLLAGGAIKRFIPPLFAVGGTVGDYPGASAKYLDLTEHSRSHRHRSSDGTPRSVYFRHPGQVRQVGDVACEVVANIPTSFEERARSAAAFLRLRANELRREAEKYEQEAALFDAEANRSPEWL